MTDTEPTRRRFMAARPPYLVALGAGLLALGGIAGAAVMAQTRPSVSMAPSVPVAIRSLSSSGIVTVRGRVAEIYGNKFVLADGTGRALVDTGPDGDRRALVATDQPVTVQGRFERGFVHAAFLVGSDGNVQALGPLNERPPHGPHDGPGHGPDRGPAAPPPPQGLAGNAPPPPPPPANGNPPPPPAAAPPAAAPAA